MRSASAARELYGKTAARSGSAPVASLLSGAAGQAALFASGVAVARILGPTDRGTLATLALVIGIVVAVGSLGLPLAVTYDVATEPGRSNAVIRWALRTFAVQAL